MMQERLVMMMSCDLIIIPSHQRETINQTGCARSEPYRGRQPWDMFNFLMSEYRPKPPEVNHEDLALAEQEGMITHK